MNNEIKYICVEMMDMEGYMYNQHFNTKGYVEDCSQLCEGNKVAKGLVAMVFFESSIGKIIDSGLIPTMLKKDKINNE